MTTTPSLAALVGATENALRRVLETTLRATAIPSYADWVALNVVAAHADLPVDRAAPPIAGALKSTEAEAIDLIQRLRASGLLGDAGLTPDGRRELAAAGVKVAAVTTSLVDGLDSADEVATRRVLDHIRARAEARLGA